MCVHNVVIKIYVWIYILIMYTHYTVRECILNNRLSGFERFNKLNRNLLQIRNLNRTKE